MTSYIGKAVTAANVTLGERPMHLRQPLVARQTCARVLAGVLSFFGIFIGSLVVGILTGLGAAYAVRSKWLAHQDGSLYEIGVVVGEEERER